MRNFLFLALLLFAGPVLAQAPDHHWPMADCQDVIGAADCVNTGGTFTPDGLRFDGGNALLPAGTFDGLPAFTIIGDLLMPAIPTADGRIVDSGGGDGFGAPGITLNLKAGIAGRIMAQINAFDGFDNAICDGMYEIGVKARVAISYDPVAGILRCYKDGVLIASPSYSPRSVAVHTRAPMFGNRAAGNRPLEGTLGEVKFYRTVLSAAEVAAEFGAPPPPPPGNTPPTIQIDQPANGSTFEPGTMVTLSATTDDIEDGPREPQWTSDIDGFLGTGNSILVMLTNGPHTITAEVMDSGGLTTSTQIAITMASAPPPPPPGSAPYPQSSDYSGIVWDLASLTTHAPGSDNWAVTWAPDGHQYVSFGDGGGFGGTNSEGRVSLGFARIEGNDPASFTGVNVNGGFNAENPASQTGKSYGLLALPGVFYATWGPGSGNGFTEETGMLRSTDNLVNLDLSPWTWTRAQDGICCATILNRGWQGRAGDDGHIYLYFQRNFDGVFDVQVPGEILMARVLIPQAWDQAAYEWFAGFNGNGVPTWVSTPLSATPVFIDPNGVFVPSVTYLPNLGYYMLTTEHDVGFAGNLGVFVSPNPWGPWETVEYSTGFFGHTGTIAWYLAPAWTGQGFEITMFFTSSDSLAIITGRLELP